MSETIINEKKVVKRSVAIALGMLCIVLAACLAGTVVLMNRQITDLQGQVSYLSRIVNREESEFWIYNRTFTIGPNENVSEWFHPNFSGVVDVKGYVQPPYSNVWVNLTWYVDYTSVSFYRYQAYPVPYIMEQSLGYFLMEYPIVSLGNSTLGANSHVGITIGNSSPAVATVDLTVWFTY